MALDEREAGAERELDGDGDSDGESEKDGETVAKIVSVAHVVKVRVGSAVAEKEPHHEAVGETDADAVEDALGLTTDTVCVADDAGEREMAADREDDGETDGDLDTLDDAESVKLRDATGDAVAARDAAALPVGSASVAVASAVSVGVRRPLAVDESESVELIVVEAVVDHERQTVVVADLVVDAVGEMEGKTDHVPVDATVGVASAEKVLGSAVVETVAKDSVGAAVVVADAIDVAVGIERVARGEDDVERLMDGLAELVVERVCVRDGRGDRDVEPDVERVFDAVPVVVTVELGDDDTVDVTRGVSVPVAALERDGLAVTVPSWPVRLPLEPTPRMDGDTDGVDDRLAVGLAVAKGLRETDGVDVHEKVTLRVGEAVTLRLDVRDVRPDAVVIDDAVDDDVAVSERDDRGLGDAAGESERVAESVKTATVGDGEARNDGDCDSEIERVQHALTVVDAEPVGFASVPEPRIESVVVGDLIAERVVDGLPVSDAGADGETTTVRVKVPPSRMTVTFVPFTTAPKAKSDGLPDADTLGGTDCERELAPLLDCVLLTDADPECVGVLERDHEPESDLGPVRETVAVPVAVDEAVADAVAVIAAVPEMPAEGVDSARDALRAADGDTSRFVVLAVIVGVVRADGDVETDTRGVGESVPAASSGSVTFTPLTRKTAAFIDALGDAEKGADADLAAEAVAVADAVADSVAAAEKLRVPPGDAEGLDSADVVRAADEDADTVDEFDAARDECAVSVVDGCDVDVLLTLVEPDTVGDTVGVLLPTSVRVVVDDHDAHADDETEMDVERVTDVDAVDEGDVDGEPDTDGVLDDVDVPVIVPLGARVGELDPSAVGVPPARMKVTFVPFTSGNSKAKMDPVADGDGETDMLCVVEIDCEPLPERVACDADGLPDDRGLRVGVVLHEPHGDGLADWLGESEADGELDDERDTTDRVAVRSGVSEKDVVDEPELVPICSSYVVSLVVAFKMYRKPIELLVDIVDEAVCDGETDADGVSERETVTRPGESVGDVLTELVFEFDDDAEKDGLPVVDRDDDVDAVPVPPPARTTVWFVPLMSTAYAKSDPVADTLREMLGEGDVEPETDTEPLGVAERDEDVESDAFVVPDTLKVARGLADAELVALALDVAVRVALADFDTIADAETRGELDALREADGDDDAVVLFATVPVTVPDDDLDEDVDADHVGQKETVRVSAAEGEPDADTDALRDAVTHAVAEREREGETVGEREESALDREPELVTDGDEDDEREAEGEGVPVAVPTRMTVAFTNVPSVELTRAMAALIEPEGVDVCEMLSVGDAE